MSVECTLAGIGTGGPVKISNIITVPHYHVRLMSKAIRPTVTHASRLMHYVSLTPGPQCHWSLMSHPGGGTTGWCDTKKGVSLVVLRKDWSACVGVSVAAVPGSRGEGFGGGGGVYELLVMFM
eukprot:1188359-Prorocentrum_minimum.AAC.5